MELSEWLAMEDVRTTENLNLLGIFHYVVGGVAALVFCFPIIHIVIGLFIVFDGSAAVNGPPPIFGWIFVIIGSAIVLAGWGLALLMLITGYKLRARKHWLFCMVMAGVECTFMPLGTVLGIFTILTLNGTSGRRVFGMATPSAHAPAVYDDTDADGSGTA